MATRIPTAEEAESLATALEAAGYPLAEAAANYRNAFVREDGDEDGCLMFEGAGQPLAEGVADRWSGLTEEERNTDLGSWLNEVFFCALLTLAAKAGEADALGTRAESLAYVKAHWN